MVLPGSHRHGYLTDDQIKAMTGKHEAISCVGDAGSAVVMRPLLLHASGRAEGNLHRRILHLEFASQELAGGVSWASV
jgi:Phytanoyl-CoA dioxygenase (PhyH)